MVWEVRAGRAGASRWAKWVDLDAASRHLEALQSLLNRAGTESLMGDGALDYQNAFGASWESEVRLYGAVRQDTERNAWREDRTAKQTERIRQLAESVRGFCLAVDLEPLNLATYAAARLNAQDNGDLGVVASAQTWSFGSAALFRLADPDKAAEIDRAMGGGVGEVRDAAYTQELYSRVDFVTGAGVRTLDDAPDPFRGVDERKAVTLNPLGWNAWDGWIVKYWNPPALAAGELIRFSALLPLSAAWEFWSGVARVLLRLKINGALARTSSYVILRNTQLSRSLGGTGLPDTVIGMSASLDVARLSGDGPLSPTEEALIGSVIALVAAINPVAGAIAGVVLAVVGLVSRLLPPAVAVPVDEWGRRGFFLLAQDYTGKLAPKAAPTHAIPPAIGPVVIPSPNLWTEGVLGEEIATIVAEQPNGGGGGGGILLAGGLALLAKLLAG